MRKIYFGISLICSLMAFQLSHAGIYWLPDYLKDNVDSNHRSETDKGGGDLPVECKNYSPSCSTPKILGGKTVRIGNIFCAIECVCPSSYSTTKCGGEYTLRGSPCTYNGINYYQGCDPRPCSSGGYFDSSSQTGKICSAVTYGGRSCYSCTDDPCYNLTDHSNDANCKNYGCQTKYAACTSKCQTCYSDNCHNRNAVNAPYGCKDYFSDCSSKCQTAYPDNCHNRTDNKTDYGCDKTWADCASKCETGKTCTTTDCSAYKLTSIPANANYTSCTPGCGNSTTTYKLVSCKTDYTDDGKGGCRAKTCAEKDANTKPCGSTCIAKTACCGGCPTGQTCSNGTCVATKCEVGYIYYSDTTCSDVYYPDKKPVGVVVNPQQRLLIDLKERVDVCPFENATSDVTFIPQESNAPISYDGQYYTSLWVKNGSFPEDLCVNNDFSGLPSAWYLPAVGELYEVNQNFKKINATLEILKSYNKAQILNDIVRLPSNMSLQPYYWTACKAGEDTSRNLTILMNSGSITLFSRKGSCQNGYSLIRNRCMNRYPCLTLDCEIPCPLESEGNASNGVNGYTKKNISCRSGQIMITYSHNPACRRCVEKSSEGDTSPIKKACAITDTVYASSSEAPFCTNVTQAETYGGAKKVGIVINKGNKVLVITQLNEQAKSVSQALQQCQNYRPSFSNAYESFSGWRLINPKELDTSSETQALLSSYLPYGLSGGIGYVFHGMGWNQIGTDTIQSQARTTSCLYEMKVY